MPFIEEPEIIDPLSPIGAYEKPEKLSVNKEVAASQSQANASIIIAQTLDPVRLIVILVIIAVLLSLKVNKWIVFTISTIGSAFLSEYLLYSMQMSRKFGQGIPTGIIASLILTSFGVWLLQRYFIKKTRAKPAN